MIQRLQIKNYAIIESLEIDFSKGLTIITGETGAGKSILLGALGLIMGNRADTKVLFEQDKKCIVEAVFDIKKYNLITFFEKHELDYDHELIIRREISPNGKSRAFINDTPATLRVLQEMSSSLIDLHHQFDTLDIHKQNFQMQMVDALAGNNEILSDYRTNFRKYTQLQRELAIIQAENSKAAREQEFVLFQLKELREAELTPGEQSRIEQELKVLSGAEEVKQNLAAAVFQLSESEQAIHSQLIEVGQLISNIGDLSDDLNRLSKRFETIQEELNDLTRDLEKAADDVEYDEEKIQMAQERLDLLYRLEQKHQVQNLDQLIVIRDELESQLESFSNSTMEEEKIAKKIKTLETSLFKTAQKLQKKRQTIIPAFEKKVKKMLATLAMPNAEFKVELTTKEVLNIQGLNEAEFLFSANKGMPLQPIKNVASGGELARLALVTKSLVASAIPLPTLIFDEIDTGISGDVALKMGGILRTLSNDHQVISITHSPQIASKADAHYFVYKKETTDRTLAKVKLLTDNEKIRAIAVMLSQNPPSTAALENAKDLLLTAK